MASIIVASTDADFYLLLSHILSEAGFVVHLASSGAEISSMSASAELAAILIDCRPGDALALDACRQIKQDAQTFGIPTVALIAPGAEHQYLDLLKAGIDESFVRPIAPEKLLTYLAGLTGTGPLRAVERNGRPLLVFADIEIDLDRHLVTRAGSPIHLGPIEFRMLRFLMERAGSICSRDELIAAAWQPGRFVDRRTVNVHIGRLRRVLEQSGGDVIHTVRAAGYVLDVQTPAASR